MIINIAAASDSLHAAFENFVDACDHLNPVRFDVEDSLAICAVKGAAIGALQVGVAVLLIKGVRLLTR